MTSRLLLLYALCWPVGFSNCALPFPFFDQVEQTDDSTALTLLALAAASSGSSGGSGGSSAGPEYIAATSLQQGGANGELYFFRKSDSDCTLDQRDSLTLGSNPYDIQRTGDSGTIYVANAGDSTISVVRPDYSAETISVTQTASVASPGSDAIPYGMTYHASGRLYTADGDNTSGSVAQQNVDSSTGQLSDIAGGYIAAGSQMWFAVLDRSQDYLFATHYGGNQVYRYSVDASTGALTQLGTTGSGTQPWHINIHPSSDFLYVTNYGSANISMYTIDPGSGALNTIGGGAIAAASAPIGLAVGSSFAYAAGSTGNAISMYSIDGSTGELTSLGSESTGAFQPYGVHLDRAESCLYVGQTDGDGDAADGLDRVAVYSINTSGTLTFVESHSAGIGPRFFTSLRQ